MICTGSLVALRGSVYYHMPNSAPAQIYSLHYLNQLRYLSTMLPLFCSTVLNCGVCAEEPQLDYGMLPWSWMHVYAENLASNRQKPKARHVLGCCVVMDCLHLCCLLKIFFVFFFFFFSFFPSVVGVGGKNAFYFPFPIWKVAILVSRNILLRSQGCFAYSPVKYMSPVNSCWDLNYHVNSQMWVKHTLPPNGLL